MMKAGPLRQTSFSGARVQQRTLSARAAPRQVCFGAKLHTAAIDGLHRRLMSRDACTLFTSVCLGTAS